MNDGKLVADRGYRAACRAARCMAFACRVDMPLPCGVAVAVAYYDAVYLRCRFGFDAGVRQGTVLCLATLK